MIDFMHAIQKTALWRFFVDHKILCLEVSMALSSTIESLLFTQGRQFAGIVPDVTIEESASDTLTITDHPVEYAAVGTGQANASISDHAFKNPSEVTCKFGWSQQMALLNSIFSGGLFSGVSSLQQMYQTLLDLQASRVPFGLSTGKRQYQNMLIRQLTQLTDAESENVLQVTIVFREVLIAQTVSTALAPANQANPQKTAGVVDRGTVTPSASNVSILASLVGV